MNLKSGDPVNLERALPADGRNSGHFVQGHVSVKPLSLSRSLVAIGAASLIHARAHVCLHSHQVDDVAEIVELRPDGDSLYVTVKPPARLLPYIVPKGFIAVDGTSLTVCEVDHTAGTFNFMLIAFTQEKIIIPKKSVGDLVNLEVDVIAKYVEQSLAAAVVARVEAIEKRLDAARQ